MLLFVPGFELFFGVHPYGWLKLSPLKRMFEGKMIMLAHERKDYGRQVTLERYPGNNALVNGFVSR